MAEKQDSRRERFCQLVATGVGVGDAYAAAGYKPDDGNSARLHAQPEIKARIGELLAAAAEKAKVDAAYLLRRLHDEAEADLADLFADDGSLKPVREWPKVWRKGLVAGLDVEELREAGAVIGTVRKVKLSDRVRRLELLGKHIDVSAFEDRVRHDGGITVTIAGADAEL